MAPQLTAHDLAHLGRFQAAARLMVAGERASAFTLGTHPLPDPIDGRAEAVRAASRARHGRCGALRQRQATGRIIPLDARNWASPSDALSEHLSCPPSDHPLRQAGGDGEKSLVDQGASSLCGSPTPVDDAEVGAVDDES